MRYLKPLLLTMALLMPVCGQAALPLSAQNKLAGTEWKLVSFGAVGAPSIIVEGTTVTIKFGTDGKAGGTGGCNSYGGDYQARGDNLTLTKIISTKRACVAQAAMEQENRYFKALELASRFKLTGDQLTIFYDEGRGALNFVKDSQEASAAAQPYENLSSPVGMLAQAD